MNALVSTSAPSRLHASLVKSNIDMGANRRLKALGSDVGKIAKVLSTAEVLFGEKG